MQPERHSERIWYPPDRTREEILNMETFTLDGHNNTFISTKQVDELFVQDPILFWREPWRPVNCSISIN